MGWAGLGWDREWGRQGFRLALYSGWSPKWGRAFLTPVTPHRFLLLVSAPKFAPNFSHFFKFFVSGSHLLSWLTGGCFMKHLSEDIVLKEHTPSARMRLTAFIRIFRSTRPRRVQIERAAGPDGSLHPIFKDVRPIVHPIFSEGAPNFAPNFCGA